MKAVKNITCILDSSARRSKDLGPGISFVTTEGPFGSSGKPRRLVKTREAGKRQNLNKRKDII